MIRRPPRSTRTDTLFPYTTLFRSETRTLSIDDGAIIAHNIPINKGWNMQMTLAAEFYAGTRSKAPVLDIVRIGNGNREQVETIHVINKREDRPIAKARGDTQSPGRATSRERVGRYR